MEECVILTKGMTLRYYKKHFLLPPSLREVPQRGGGSGVRARGHSPSHRLSAVTAPSEREPSLILSLNEGGVFL